MSIDKFLEPREKNTASMSFNIVDSELNESAIYDAEYYQASSKQFRDANIKAQREVLKQALDPADGELFIIGECFVKASLNGEELTQEQNNKLLSRYPELIGKIDVEVSKGAVFIRPLSSGSETTQKESSTSLPRSRKARK